jgi:hypothetical protein
MFFPLIITVCRYNSRVVFMCGGADGRLVMCRCIARIYFSFLFNSLFATLQHFKFFLAARAQLNLLFSISSGASLQPLAVATATVAHKGWVSALCAVHHVFVLPTLAP